jgi:hypothetical protein
MRCAAATIDATPAEETLPAVTPSPLPVQANYEDEYISSGPALRANKKRSRRFKEMEKKVPAKTTLLGALGTNLRDSFPET